MPFRILSQDELDLLTEQQKISYEKERIVYEERSRFVKKIEEWENIDIKPYKPKLVCIDTVKKYPQKEFACKDCVAKRNDVFITPKLKDYNVNFDKNEKIKQINPTLPKIKNIKIAVREFNKIENEISGLPKVSKININKKTVKNFKQIPPKLPVFNDVKIPMNKAVKPIEFGDLSTALNIAHDKIKMPQKQMAKAETRINLNLPKVNVEIPDISYDAQPKLNIVDLPKFKEMKVREINNLKIDISKQLVEKVLVPTKFNKVYKKPEIDKLELTVVPKVNVPKNISKKQNYNLPDIRLPKIKLNKPVSKLDVPSVDISSVVEESKCITKTIVKPIKIEFKSQITNSVEEIPKIKINQHSLKNIPDIEKISVDVSGVARKVKNITANMIKPQKRELVFDVSKCAKDVPKIERMDVPNFYENEIVKKILSREISF